MYNDYERFIRLKVALSIVEDIHSDYCRDLTTTREQCARFTDVVIAMQCYIAEFSNQLDK